jgi:hypothetical protein
MMKKGNHYEVILEKSLLRPASKGSDKNGLIKKEKEGQVDVL